MGEREWGKWSPVRYLSTTAHSIKSSNLYQKPQPSLLVFILCIKNSKSLQQGNNNVWVLKNKLFAIHCWAVYLIYFWRGAVCCSLLSCLPDIFLAWSCLLFTVELFTLYISGVELFAVHYWAVYLMYFWRGAVCCSLLSCLPDIFLAWSCLLFSVELFAVLFLCSASSSVKMKPARIDTSLETN